MDEVRVKEFYGDRVLSLEEVVQEEAYKLWLSMRRMILKVVRKVIKFNNIYEEEDYVNEAYFAVLEAYVKYDRFHKYKECDPEMYEILSKKPSMKLQTYAYWYVQKRIYQMAQTGEVEFVDEDGQVIQASDFYRTRRKNKNKQIFSRKKVFTFSELSYLNGSNNKNDRDNYYEAVEYETRQKIRRGKYL